MRIRCLVYGLAMPLSASLTAPFAAAALAASPGAFVTELAHKAPVFMSSRTLSSIERQQRREKLLDEYFDMPWIARFVFGNYWQGANDGDRQKFTEVLRDVLAHTYSDRFIRYTNESFRVTNQRALDADNSVIYSDVSDPVLGEQTKVEWHVIRRDGYRIIDMRIVGASMAKVIHDDFGLHLQRNKGDLPKLIQELQAKFSAEKPG